jgi:hypothetical protein
MKYPFELPVKKIPDSKEFEGLWVVVDKAGMIIGFPLKDFEADYIVQAINSHEKFKTALENIAELETDCCQRCEGNGRLYADGKTHLMSENAETILCGNCGGSGRILPEDAQTIASEALKEVEKP